MFHQFNQSWIDFETAANAMLEPVRSNFSTRLRYAWRDLTTNPNFYLIKADKGGRFVMWKREDYRKEALRQLQDTAIYRRLTRRSAEDAYNRVNEMKKYLANQLLTAGHISRQEETRLLAVNYSIPCIYFLPKIHKDKRVDTGTFAGRPIVATFSGCLKAKR